MTDITDFLLTSVLVYGPWVLGLATLLSAAGLPLPGTMLLLAAGAFARQGVVSWSSVAGLAVMGAVLGDGLSYGLGRWGGAPLMRRFGSGAAGQQARALFRQWGGISIFLTRFLITPLALPVNLLAGSEGYPPLRFMTYVITGEALWVLGFGSLGYLFADRWEVLSDLAANFSGLLIGLVLLLAGGLYFLSKRVSIASRLKPQPQAPRA